MWCAEILNTRAKYFKAILQQAVNYIVSYESYPAFAFASCVSGLLYVAQNMVSLLAGELLVALQSAPLLLGRLRGSDANAACLQTTLRKLHFKF